jgi:excisionase family DNA binding protein
MPDLVSADTPLDVPECAKRLGVSVPYVRKLVQHRAIPFHRVGRRIVFARPDIDRFFEAGRVEPEGGDRAIAEENK